MKLYGIESKQTYYGDKFRWYSKYNGARGPWCYGKDDAAKGGAEHEGVIKTLFGKEENLNGAQHTQDASPSGNA